MRNKVLSFVAITVTILLGGCSDNSTSSQEDMVAKAPSKHTEQKHTQIKQVPKEKEVVILPTFNLQTSTGKKIKITADTKNGWKFDGYEGKIILLNFFGTWCPPCKREIPHLNSIRSQISDKFEIIALDVGPRGGGATPPAELEEFIKKYDVKYPITVNEENDALFDGVMDLNRAGSIPFMLLFDKNGFFAKHYIGLVSKEELQSDIDILLSR